MNLYTLAQKHHPWAVSLRRHFHQYPEVSGEEYQTQAKLLAELKALQINCRPAGTTGVIAEIHGKNSGKTIAIRADIDALPIQDECNTPYQSKNKNACHACGHDGHIAVVFGTLQIIHELRDKLQGTFRFIFQPREEQFPSGAVSMIEDGALDNVDAIIGAHIWQPISLGTIGITYGNLMASPDKFKITVHGKGGHGSMPQQTVDPILIASQIVLGLNTIVSRSIDPLELAVVSVGSIQAGNTFNIIPETATLEGTVRSFDENVRQQIFARIEAIVSGICAANDATAETETLLGHPAIINVPSYSKAIAKAVEKCHAPIKVEEVPPVMCGEDFSYYLKHVPGAFFFIGTGTDKMIYPHHHPKFDLDERAILYGMEVMARTAIDLAIG